MRLDRVYIDGFKNLKNVEADFDEGRLTTVIIGENGAGKSNLLEAIADVFRFVDMARGKPRYSYEIDYRINGHRIRLSNKSGSPQIFANDKLLSRAAFERAKSELFPDLIFGYYSGGSRRLERLFDSHQRAYYDKIKLEDDPDVFRRANNDRRLFYCRPIHGVFALLSSFSFPDESVDALLADKLGITGFHSALSVFKEPWFAKGGATAKFEASSDFWGAKGPAGGCARAIRDESFHPIRLTANPIDDYRDKQQSEAQYACFLRDSEALSRLGDSAQSEQQSEGKANRIPA